MTTIVQKLIATVFGNSGVKTAVKSMGVALLLLLVHYVSIQTYACWCAPLSVFGALTSIFTVASPPCTFLLTVASKSQELYVAAWIAMGVAIVSLIGGLWEAMS